MTLKNATKQMLRRRWATIIREDAKTSGFLDAVALTYGFEDYAEMLPEILDEAANFSDQIAGRLERR